MIPKLSLLFLAFAVTSCYHVYYAPNTANAPLLKEKGEVRVNAFYCSGGDSEFGGGELQAACAVSKNVGVMANFFSAGKTQEVYDYSSRTSHEEKGSGNYLEFAGGMFKAFGRTKKWVGEAYAGGGFGSVKNDYGFGDNSRVGILKFFIQPAFGYKSKGFEFALVPKISFVDQGMKESNIRSQTNESSKSEVNFIEGKTGSVFFEPAFLLRGGGRDFKFQAGVSFCARGKNTGHDFLAETVTTSFGISIDIKPDKK